MTRFTMGLFLVALLTTTSVAANPVEKSQQIASFLQRNVDRIAPDDIDDINRSLRRAEFILSDYGYQEVEPNPYRFELSGDTLSVYWRPSGQLVFTWHKHDISSVRAGILGLLDRDNEFAALRVVDDKAVVLVENWKDATHFTIHPDYIGLRDSKGIVDTYSTTEAKKRLISNWKNTVQHAFEPNYVALLDDEAERNFEIFTTSGRRVFETEGVTKFECIGAFEIVYTKSGREFRLNVRDYLP